MRLGVAKVNKHAVAHIPRQETAEAAHSFSGAFPIGRDELSQVFRIHPSGECGRTNEVQNITVTCRRSAESWAFGCASTAAASLVTGVAPVSSLMAATFLRVCPMRQPMTLESVSVKYPSTEISILFSPKRAVYSDRPTFSSQSAI